jgi:hypothetical protein
MIWAAYVLVGGGLKASYCDVVGMFRPQVCAEYALADEPPRIAPEETEEPEMCVVLQEAEGGSQCDQSQDCTLLPGIKNGSYSAAQQVDSLVIKAGREYHIYQCGTTDDGCYHATIDGNTAIWDKVGGGRDCQDVSHLQSWYRPICR